MKVHMGYWVPSMCLSASVRLLSCKQQKWGNQENHLQGAEDQVWEAAVLVLGRERGHRGPSQDWTESLLCLQHGPCPCVTPTTPCVLTTAGNHPLLT